MSKDFGWICSTSPFKPDYISAVFFYLFLQGSNRLDVGLSAHAMSMSLTSIAMFVVGFLRPTVRHSGRGETMALQGRRMCWWRKE